MTSPQAEEIEKKLHGRGGRKGGLVDCCSVPLERCCFVLDEKSQGRSVTEGRSFMKVGCVWNSEGVRERGLRRECLPNEKEFGKESGFKRELE